MPFLAGRFGEPRIHLRIFVGFTSHGSLEIGRGITDRQPGGRVAHLRQELQVTERMSGFTVGGVLEHTGRIGVAFYVRLAGKVQIAPVGLGFAGERSFQVLLGFAPFKFHC